MAATEPGGYDSLTRIFHWTIAGLVFVMIPAGVAMTSEGLDSVRDPLFILHKGTGSLLLLLVLARVGWRLVRPHTPALPGHFPPLQRRMAGFAHGLLYVLLVTQVVSGYVRTVGHGYPIEALDALGIPPLIPEIPGPADVMAVVHKFTAYILTAVISVHLGAVVHQQLIAQEGVIARMWPPLRPSHAPRPAGAELLSGADTDSAPRRKTDPPPTEDAHDE